MLELFFLELRSSDASFLKYSKDFSSGVKNLHSVNITNPYHHFYLLHPFTSFFHHLSLFTYHIHPYHHFYSPHLLISSFLLTIFINIIIFYLPHSSINLFLPSFIYSFTIVYSIIYSSYSHTHYIHLLILNLPTYISFTFLYSYN